MHRYNEQKDRERRETQRKDKKVKELKKQETLKRQQTTKAMLDPKDIHVIDQQIKETMKQEDDDFKALSQIVGKPKAKEAFPAFKSPIIDLIGRKRAQDQQSESSSSSGYDSGNENRGNEQI